MYSQVGEAGEAAAVAGGHVVTQVHGGSCDHEIVCSQDLAAGRKVGSEDGMSFRDPAIEGNDRELLQPALYERSSSGPPHPLQPVDTVKNLRQRDRRNRETVVKLLGHVRFDIELATLGRNQNARVNAGRSYFSVLHRFEYRG